MKKTLLALSIFLAAGLPAAAQQDDVAAFFKGKTMRLVVGMPLNDAPIAVPSYGPV